jgi:hypothetical protein
MTDSSASIPEGFAPAGHVLVRTIGRGASSVVQETRRLATGEAAAVKILDDDVAAAEAVGFLAGERAAMPALAGHPNVLTVFEAGVEGERPWLATELCRRGSLAALVAESQLDGPTALRVLARLADALAVAHDAGVLHSNVTPRSVLLTDAGEPALGDFGIAAGTTARTDVQALGTTVRELLARSDADPVEAELRTLLDTMTTDDDGGPATMTEVAAAADALAREQGVDLDAPAFPPIAEPVEEPEVPADSADPAPAEPEPPAEPDDRPPAEADGWSAPLPAEQIATFVPTGSIAHGVPYTADPDGDRLFTTPAPFRPRLEEEPGPRSRLPVVAASVLGVLVTVGVVFGVSQGRSTEPEAPLSAVSPAALAPAATTTTQPPEAATTTTEAPPPTSETTQARATSARSAPVPRTAVAPRTRATRAPVTRAQPTTKATSSDDSDSKKKKKKKKSDG